MHAVIRAVVHAPLKWPRPLSRCANGCNQEEVTSVQPVGSCLLECRAAETLPVQPVSVPSKSFSSLMQRCYRDARGHKADIEFQKPQLDMVAEVFLNRGTCWGLAHVRFKKTFLLFEL